MGLTLAGHFPKVTLHLIGFFSLCQDEAMIVRLIASTFACFAVASAVCLQAADAVPAPGGAATLGPQNTKIEFVCAHVGPKPDPRTGGFAKFSGKATVSGQSLKSVSLDIDTTSLFTQFDMLTTHLKSPDFFEVRRYPTAKFESTKIEGSSTATQVTGKLTLHGVTKEISIPASVEITDAGLKLTSQFTINRLDYGINFDPKKVENQVKISVTIGEKS
jgi:polyisoprenoid-binding protein YceI